MIFWRVVFLSLFNFLVDDSFLSKVNDALPPMPKKQNMAMLEGPPLQKPTASMTPHYKTLPPIGSAPPIGRQPVFTTPRKLATAPGMAETILRDTEQTRYSRTRSTPPGIPEYGSGPSTRQTVKTEGEVTVGESIGTTIGRGQPRAEGQVNTEDGFFMTQVTCWVPRCSWRSEGGQ